MQEDEREKFLSSSNVSMISNAFFYNANNWLRILLHLKVNNSFELI